MDLMQLLDFGYITDINPGGDFATGFLFLALSILCLMTKSSIRSISRLFSYPKYFIKSTKGRTRRFIPFGVVGIILVLVRFGQVGYVSMRIWLVLWLMGLIVVSSYTKIQIWQGYRKRVASARREAQKQ